MDFRTWAVYLIVSLVGSSGALAQQSTLRAPAQLDSNGISVDSYRSIQQAIDANPGRMIFVPARDYEIAEPIRIRSDSSGLFGPGRIIQTNANRQIILIEGGSDITLRDLTLTRKSGARETMAEGIRADGCRDLVLENLKVLDNRTRSSAIEIAGCKSASVRNCLIRNYHRVSIDDRTAGTNYGYAFQCLIGTGLMVHESQGTLIQGNRIVEEELIPTPEIMQKFELGKFVKKTTKGPLISQKDWDRGFTANWMQGSAIVVTSPESTDLTRILGNSVENTGQGIDIHSDRVIVSQNIVHDTLIGMKAMHGSRNVLIVGNQFSGNSLWSIGLMPGIASHGARPKSNDSKATAANVDGGSIIANNIISDFGSGRTNWIWAEQGGNGFPLRFDRGQEPDDPPLTDVLIQGNIVCDSGALENSSDASSKSNTSNPPYKYAVLIETGVGSPERLHFTNNIFHPGTDGISNVELKP